MRRPQPLRPPRPRRMQLPSRRRRRRRVRPRRPRSTAAAPKAAPPAMPILVPAGTQLAIEVITPLSTKTNKVGDSVDARLASDLDGRRSPRSEGRGVRARNGHAGHLGQQEDRRHPDARRDVRFARRQWRERVDQRAVHEGRARATRARTRPRSSAARRPAPSSVTRSRARMAPSSAASSAAAAGTAVAHEHGRRSEAGRGQGRSRWRRSPRSRSGPEADVACASPTSKPDWST